MRISLERSGGFMGIPMTTAIDTDRLSRQEGEQLQQLIDTIDFSQLPALTTTAPQPDRFQYRLTIETHEQAQTVSFSESNLPIAVQPLVDWLLQTVYQT